MANAGHLLIRNACGVPDRGLEAELEGPRATRQMAPRPRYQASMESPYDWVSELGWDFTSYQGGWALGLHHHFMATVVSVDPPVIDMSCQNGPPRSISPHQPLSTPTVPWCLTILTLWPI